MKVKETDTSHEELFFYLAVCFLFLFFFIHKVIYITASGIQYNIAVYFIDISLEYGGFLSIFKLQQQKLQTKSSWSSRDRLRALRFNSRL